MFAKYLYWLMQSITYYTVRYQVWLPNMNIWFHGEWTDLISFKVCQICLCRQLFTFSALFGKIYRSLLFDISLPVLSLYSESYYWPFLPGHWFVNLALDSDFSLFGSSYFRSYLWHVYSLSFYSELVSQFRFLNLTPSSSTHTSLNLKYYFLNPRD